MGLALPALQQATGWLHKADVKTALAGFFKGKKVRPKPAKCTPVWLFLLISLNARPRQPVSCDALRYSRRSGALQVDRLAELLEALDTDEAGDALHYSCLFSDDDELNQGMTAEIIRSQHLAERLEFLQVRCRTY